MARFACAGIFDLPEIVAVQLIEKTVCSCFLTWHRPERPSTYSINSQSGFSNEQTTPPQRAILADCLVAAFPVRVPRYYGVMVGKDTASRRAHS